jgi:hypothetical protein
MQGRRQIALLCAGAIGCAFAAGCASHKLPASPVPAALNDHEAAVLANQHMDQRRPPVERPLRIRSIRPMGWGQLVAYQSSFDPLLRPAKEWRLVTVKHDGTARELWFPRGE